MRFWREQRVKIVKPFISMYPSFMSKYGKKDLCGMAGLIVDISVDNTGALVIVDGDLMHDIPLSSLEPIQ